ncbi:MAG: glycosyltransferase family 2 protein [Candidatus Levyibacteriota bacterium]
MDKVPELSIFFPFWNEEENIEKVVRKAIPVAQKVASKWEIIMVDDGSSDSTLKIAKELAQKDSHLVVVADPRNRGYGAALKHGFSSAKYNLVVFIDGDGQFDFGEVSRLLAKINNADMVIGFRKRRLDHPFRHVLMNLLKIWDFVLFGLYFKDIDCGFKLFRKEALRKLMPLKSEGAMITTEILAKARKKNLKVEQAQVSHYPRKYGNQSGGNARVIIRAIRESLVLWKDLHYGRS